METTIESTFVWVDYTSALAVATTGNDFTHDSETVKPHVTVKVRFRLECVQHKIILLTYAGIMLPHAAARTFLI